MSTTVADTPRHPSYGNGARSETSRLACEILAQRVKRPAKQNKKLDLEIQRQEQQYGDIAQIRRDVRRANAGVKQSLYAMAARIADQLAMMDDPGEIREFLHDRFTEAFNDLAYEDGAGRRGPSSA